MGRSGRSPRTWIVLIPSSGISVALGVTEILFSSLAIPDIRRVTPTAADKNRLQLVHALTAVAILLAVVQMLNCTIFWYRLDKVFLRCISLIVIDAMVIAICVGITSIKIRETENREQAGSHRQSSYDQTVVPVIEMILWTAVAQLGLHAVTVAAWTWLLPARMRFANHQRPTADSGIRWLKALLQRQKYSPLRLDSQGQELGALLPLEKLFWDHEKRWRENWQAPQNRLNEEVSKALVFMYLLCNQRADCI